jgi:hypothetical protein
MNNLDKSPSDVWTGYDPTLIIAIGRCILQANLRSQFWHCDEGFIEDEHVFSKHHTTEIFSNGDVYFWLISPFQ